MKIENIISRARVSIAVLVGMSLSVTTALAGDVTVRVLDQVSGNLLSGVSVCVGSGANPRQFGAAVTDAVGQVHFDDIPRTSLVLTASAKAYNSLRRDFLGQDKKSIQIIRLQTGNRSGARCEARAVTDAGRSSLHITSFYVAGGARNTDDRSVAVRVRFQGDATEYRASESANLQNVEWKSFQTDLKFELSKGTGNKKVFFQLRRVLSVDGASLQVTSNIVSDTIYLAK